MHKRIFFSCALFIFLMSFNFFGFAVEGIGTLDGSHFIHGADQHMLMQARSSVTYRVTPGDVYTLTFMLNGELVEHTIVVDTAYACA